MPWVNLHPLYSSRLTKSKRWVARKAVINLPNGRVHDPNLHPHYEADDAPLYPWTSSTFPRPRGSRYDAELQRRVEEKRTTQYTANQSKGDQYGFREGAEPIYGPERPRIGIVWHRRDGVPILGPRRVRRILLAAVFPEFYTTQEVDALHNLLDEERTARCRFFGEKNTVPDRNRLEWGYRAGQFESIRWAGSPPDDPLGLSPWWASGIMSGLLNEMPPEYIEHIRPYMEVKAVVYDMTGMATPMLR
ncbi:hypothetical protein BT69DRAFT_1316810 [Atractiella rhizophila]|nr:hypothetical protein BT69DRAFT_1316810 [Atractiella rhizophila]